MTFSVISPASLTPLTAAQLEGTDLVILWNPNGASATKMQTITVAQLLAYLTPLIVGGTYQPLDPDLTAIAALTTAAYGRDLLTLSDQSALRTLIGLASMAYQSAGAVDITGGTINGTVVGGTTPAYGTFTTVESTSAVVVYAEGDAGSGSLTRYASAAGLTIWDYGKTGVAVGVGNTGADIAFYAYDNTGALLRTQLVLERSTGLVRTFRLAVGTGAFYTELVNNATANRALQLPNANGTLARVEDFAAPPTIGSTTPGAATFSALAVSPTAGVFYVATTGSDSNDGLTVGTPFLTVQRAIDVAASRVWGGVNITINVANGTYTGLVNCKTVVGCLTLTVVGNTTTPSNVVLTASGLDTVLSLNCRTTYEFAGFRITNTNGNGNNVVSVGSIVNLRQIEFGACIQWHMYCGLGGTITVNVSCSILSSAARFINIFDGGTVAVFASVTIPSAISIPYTIFANNGARVIWLPSSVTGAANLTGAKFWLDLGSVGLNLANAPGTSAGILTNGAVENNSISTHFNGLSVGGSAAVGARTFTFVNNLGTITLSANPTQNATINLPVSPGTLALIPAQQNFTDAVTISWDTSISTSARLVATSGVGATRALAMSGMVAGLTGTLRFRQDSVGGRSITHAGIPIPVTSGANTYTIIRFYYDGTNFFWDSQTPTVT